MTDERSEEKNKSNLPPEDVRRHKANTDNDDEDILDNNTRINPSEANKETGDQKENSERTSGGDTQGNP